MSKNELYKIDIDLGDLPGYIGRANNGHTDYRYTDLRAIFHEFDKQFQYHTENVCVTITGIMPTWLAMDITKFMYDQYMDEKIEMFRYVTPSMILKCIEPYVIFPKEV